MDASMDASTAESLVARLQPAGGTDAAIADAVNAWTAVQGLLPTEHSYNFNGPVSVLWEAGLPLAIVSALSHPSSLIKIAALQVTGCLVRNVNASGRDGSFGQHNLGAIVIGLLLDNDTSVRAAAANTVLDMASGNSSCSHQVSESGSLFARAIAAQSERHMILSLLAVIGKSSIRYYRWNEPDKKPLLKSILPLLDMDEEVAADAATCISFVIPNAVSEVEEMHVVSAIVNRLKTIHEPRHQLPAINALCGILGRYSGKPLVLQAVQAGILDTLDAVLAQLIADIGQHRELVYSVSRFAVLVLSEDDVPVSSTSLASIVAKLVSLVGHQDKELSKNVLDQLYEPIRYTYSARHAAIMEWYLQHGIIPALFKNIKHSGIGDGPAVEMLNALLAASTDKPENPAAVEMEAIGFPAVLQDLINHADTPPRPMHRLLEIMRNHFSHHIKTADTSILPNENNIDLPTPLIPEMEQPFLTVKERDYLALRSAVLSKPLWWTKFTDATIAAKWREEAVAQGVSQRALSLLFSELAYLAEHEMRTVKLASGDVVTVTPGAAKCTTMSNDAVPESLRDTLIRQVAVLEDVPDHKKDWHPGSDGMVLDLVHPSLYPLVYGRSLVLSRNDRAMATSTPPWDVMSASERVSGKPSFGNRTSFVSLRFQWLPSEFCVHDDGTVSINSYINNLHPIWNNSLYKTIAKVFERFVPLFESLFGYSDGLHLYIDDPCSLYMTRHQLRDFQAKIAGLPDDDDDEAYEAAVDVVSKVQSGEEEEDDDDDDDWDNLPDSDFLQPRLPATFSPPETPVAPVSLRGRDLQVIVKLANIHLTPENPEYGGGTWHVEGAANESIVATGIYYYDMANITASRLSFRTTVNTEDPPFEYEQSEHTYYEEVYGFQNETGDGVQDLGSIQASQGRCIAFPNSWQHHVEPFKLADPSKPGHRKILVFFLVDPTKHVVSTAHVAPQQQDWYETGVVASRLPPELGVFVTPHVPGTMSTAKSHAVRAQLMEERSVIDTERTGMIETFNLCEH
ncbi:hypothetical protein BC831DRAFT_504617 [Entophlyctis helioformis]|nr:hypothetical protein BC831DRAFT_504617 [Entophlyctis helioformis]